jgi:hypothetical protein
MKRMPGRSQCGVEAPKQNPQGGTRPVARRRLAARKRAHYALPARITAHRQRTVELTRAVKDLPNNTR